MMANAKISNTKVKRPDANKINKLMKVRFTVPSIVITSSNASYDRANVFADKAGFPERNERWLFLKNFPRLILNHKAFENPVEFFDYTRGLLVFMRPTGK